MDPKERARAEAVNAKETLDGKSEGSFVSGFVLTLRTTGDNAGGNTGKSEQNTH